MQEVQKQLISYCQRNNISVNPAERPDKDSILKAFLSGYIMNTAILQMDGSYRTCFSYHVSSAFDTANIRLWPSIRQAFCSVQGIHERLRQSCTMNWWRPRRTTSEG